jgi:hypothetical protein
MKAFRHIYPIRSEEGRSVARNPASAGLLSRCQEASRWNPEWKSGADCENKIKGHGTLTVLAEAFSPSAQWLSPWPTGTPLSGA